MKVYVTRHGQTDWNLEGRLQGWADNPINQNGINQALELREQIKDIKFSICYASTLKRAAQTAQILIGSSSLLSNEKSICPIRYDKRIRERGFGTIDSIIEEGLKDFIYNESWDMSLNSGKYGVEPIRTIYSRIYDFCHNELPKVKAEFGDDASILIVSHGGATRVINYVMLGGSEIPDKNSEIWQKSREFRMKNCGLAVYDI